VVSRNVIGSGVGFRVADVHCPGSSRWSDVEHADCYTLVLVRRGCFRRRTRAGTWLLDAGAGYFERPGEEQLIFHPRPGGDSCTALFLDESVLSASPPEGMFFSTPQVDTLHQRLLDQPSLDAAVALVDLATAVKTPRGPHRRLADAARELLVEQPASTLEHAASALAVSAPHLSRTFHAETGETFSRYRNRVRVRVALERIRQGETSLSRLAADLGFSDHPHLTRTVKRETGLTPRAAGRRGRLASRLRGQSPSTGPGPLLSMLEPLRIAAGAGPRPAGGELRRGSTRST
jgi:AraC-like DNA-binding protein